MAEGRQIFSYKGVEYDLPSSYTPEQALSRIKSHLVDSQKSGWEKFTEGVGAGVGMKDRAAAFTALTKNAPNTPAYKQAQQRLQALQEADTAGQSWQATAGRILGQAPLEIADFLTGGGVSEASAGAEEYLRRAQEPETKRKAKAIEYARATGVSNVLGNAVGQGATRLGTAAKQAVGNVAAAAAPEVGQGRELTPEQIALNAVVGGGIGALTHSKTLAANKQQKQQSKSTPVSEDNIDPEVAAKMKQYQEVRGKGQPQVNPKDLIPADIDKAAPAGTNFEMQLPGAKGTKKGKEQAKRINDLANMNMEESGQGVIHNPDQLDMFVEDNKKVVQDELFKSALEQSNEYARQKARAVSAKLLEEEQAPWKAEDEKLAMYKEMFPIAENKALPTQRVSPEFEQASLFGQPTRENKVISAFPNDQFARERQDMRAGLFQNANGEKPLTPFGEAGVKLYDENGRTISSRGMGIDASIPPTPKEYSPFWKQVEENKSWEQFKQEQNTQRQKEWSTGIHAAEKEAADRSYYESIQKALETTPAPDYGMGKKTREFITEQTMSLGRRRTQQGGFIDPTVFVDGFKKAIDLIHSGVTKFKEFADYMVNKFGDGVKPHLNSIWSSSKQHVGEIKGRSLNVIQKYSMGVHESAQAINDVNFSNAIENIDRIAGDIRDVFRNKFYGEQYSGGIKGAFRDAGVKYGKGKFADIMRTKHFDTMLEKYKPYWNSAEYVDPTKLGFTPQEMNTFLDLRSILDDVGQGLGVDIARNPNYMPRMREGTHAVISRTPTGALHVEATNSVTGAKALEKQLSKEGHTIIKAGLRSDLMQSPEYRSLIMDEFEPEGLHSPFTSHLQEAANVSGYAGQRNTKDMLLSLQKYMNRAENELIRRQYQQLLPELQKKLSSDQMEVLQRYMETSIGLGFIHQPKWIRDLGNDLVRNVPALGYGPDVVNAIGKATYAYKIMPSVANVLQAIVSPIGALAQLSRLAGNEGLNLPTASREIMKTSIRSLVNAADSTDKYIADRAIRSGYLQSMTDMVDIEKKLRAGNISSVTGELAKDLFRAGRIELKVRKDFLTGMYNYYRSTGMSVDDAFHKAGRDTRNAFVGIRPEDRAPWVQAIGPLSGTIAALTTYPIGMAGKLYSNMGLTKGQIAAFAVIGMGSIVVAGLRGSPVAETMEMANLIYNQFADDPEKVSSFDNYLIEMGKKYPVLVHGIPSQLMGVDMARSLGWPSMFSLLPFWNQMKGIVQQQMGQPGDMGIATMPKMASDAVNAMYKLISNQPMTDREKEMAWQAVLPRFAQKAMDTNNVYDSKGKLLGTVSDESTMAAKLTGTRSLEEAQVRAKEANVQTGLKEINKMTTDSTNKLIKAVLYGTPEQADEALGEFTKTQQKLSEYGQADNIDEVFNSAVQEVINTSLTPEQRAIFSGKLDEVVYRLTREENE